MKANAFNYIKELDLKFERICFLIHSMNKSGGTERVCANLANSLSNHGYSVRVATLFGGGTFFPLDRNVPLFSLGCKSEGLFSMWLCLDKFFKKEVNEEFVVCISMGKLSSIAALVRRLNFGDTKLHGFIASEHVGYDSFDILKKIIKRAGYLAADKVVFLTERDRDRVSGTRTGKKYFCIPNFVMQNDYKNKTYASNRKIALSIGRLCYQKNFQRLIRVWQDAMEKGDGLENSWELYIVGDGEDKRELVFLINKSNCKNIRMIKATKDISSIYAKSDLFLMTSRYEGLPMVLIESQAFGLPAIVFDCPTGPAEVVVNERSGYLVDYNDDEYYVECLVSTLSNDNLRKNMSNFAFENARRFSESEVVNKWMNVLK